MRPRDEQKIIAIRDTCIEIISKDGIDGFSMQKLAKEANISPATPYLYYKDKDDLLIQLYADVLDEIHSKTYDGIHPDLELGAGIKLIFENRHNHCIEKPFSYSFIYQLMHSPSIRNTNHKKEELEHVVSLFFKQNGVAQRGLGNVINGSLTLFTHRTYLEAISPKPNWKFIRTDLSNTLAYISESLAAQW